MKSLEQRIEAIERSAKRWKLATLAAVGLCCFMGAGDGVARFDEIEVKRLIFIGNDGKPLGGVMEGMLACQRINVITSDMKDQVAIADNSVIIYSKHDPKNTLAIHRAEASDYTTDKYVKIVPSSR